MEPLGTLEKLVLGIRHERTFTVKDVLGSVIDQMKPLQGTGSFPEECFQRVLWTKDGIILRDSESDYTTTMSCDIDGLFLDCDVLTEPPLSEDKFVEMFHRLANVILPMHEGHRKINRIGMIHQYAFPAEKNAAVEAMEKLLSFKIIGKADSMTLRASLKHPTEDAIDLPDKKGDYKNTILEVASRRDPETKEPNIITVTIDFQRYYYPDVPLSKIDVQEHAREASRFIEKHIRSSALNFSRANIAHA